MHVCVQGGSGEHLRMGGWAVVLGCEGAAKGQAPPT